MRCRRWFWSSIVGCTLIVTLSAQAPKPKFEVASIRPQLVPLTSFEGIRAAAPSVRPGGVFNATHATVAVLIMFAYDVKIHQVLGGPDWIQRTPFDINARAGGDVPPEQIKVMVQSLLEDRFGLVVHTEQREMPVLALRLANADGRPGPYLRAVAECSAAARKQLPGRPYPSGGVGMSGCGPISRLADFMTYSQFALPQRLSPLDRPVIDRTGLSGDFDYELRYASSRVTTTAAPADSSLPSFETALQEDLGLKLEPTRGVVDVLVIDSVHPPTEN